MLREMSCCLSLPLSPSRSGSTWSKLRREAQTSQIVVDRAVNHDSKSESARDGTGQRIRRAER